MAEHHTLRPKARTAVETTGPCQCAACAHGRPWVSVQAYPSYDAAALMVMGVGGSTAVQLDAGELRRVASLCLEAAQELEQKDQAGRGVPLCRLN